MATTTNMGLNLPDVSITPGPTWATLLNAAFVRIDAHNHTSDKGLQIPTAGINIDAALEFNTQRLSNAYSLGLFQLDTDETINSTIYNKNGDLFYKNGAGTVVKITNGSILNIAATGGFGGDYGTGEELAKYTTSTTLFEFFKDADANELAKLACSDLKIANFTNNTQYLTLKAQSGAVGNFYLPATLPASGEIYPMVMVGTADGAALAYADRDFAKTSTGETGAWTTTSSTDEFIDDGTTDLSVSYKALGGRPVVVKLIAPDSALSYVQIQSANSAPGADYRMPRATITLYRDGVAVRSFMWRVDLMDETNTMIYRQNPETITFTDIPAVSGTVVYKIAVKVENDGTTVGYFEAQNCKMLVYSV